jgi:predicted phosphatase
MKISIKSNTIIVFDLDKTIWDCTDKYGNSIWAKQLIPPYTFIDDNTIIDDCFSVCKLQKGFKEFIEKIENKIVFLSNGLLFDSNETNQPSINVLKMFDLYKYFDKDSLLTYKTFKKEDYFNCNNEYLFFDDDDNHLINVKKHKNVLIIDRKSMGEWCDIIIQK